MSSEADRGISNQPPPTCPIIDSAIGAMDKARDYAGQIVDADNDETRKSHFRDVDSELDMAEAQMEDARRNTEAIREWGQEWKDRAQELENIIQSIRDNLSSVRDQEQVMSSYLDDISRNLEDI